MKILLLGGNGMLGTQILKELSYLHDVYTLGRSAPESSKNHIFIDVNNELEFSQYLKKEYFDLIINSIAITNHNYCDRNLLECFRINSILNSVILESTPSETSIIYISSDAVFSDENLMRLPDSCTSPQSIYGLSKELGEKILLLSSSTRKFLIIRTTIVGLSPKKNSFVDWIINSVKGEKNITLFSDVLFNPVSIYELSRFLVGKLEVRLKERELIHVCNKENLSKYQFAIKIISEIGLDTSLIKCGTMKSYPDRGNRCFNQVLESPENQENPFTFKSTVNSIIKDYECQNKISSN